MGMNNDDAIQVINSRLKSGKMTQVAVIPETLVAGDGPERMIYRAWELAKERGCSHYRVVAVDGAIRALGKVGQMLNAPNIGEPGGDR